MFALRNWLSLTFHLAAVFLLAHATPAPIRSHLHVLEDFGTVPQGWTQGHAPSPETRLRFRLALQQESDALAHLITQIMEST